MSDGRIGRPADRRRADGWWYPWIFVGGMLLVIAVNMVLVREAIDTFPGLETEDAYRKGIDYNTALAAAREQQRRGWQATIAFDADQAAAGNDRHEGRLSVRFVDREGAPLSGLAVSAILSRPTQGGHDFEVPLVDLGEGRYGANLELPLRGQWEARILAARGDARFQDTHRLLVP